MVNALFQTVLSVVSAVIAATLGYLKNKPTEDFDGDKFLRTVLLGFAVGLIQVALNVTPGSAEGLAVMFLIQTGLIDTVERVLKALWGNFVTPKTLN